MLSKKVPYPCDKFLLSACQFAASSQSNGKFMEFICLHGADYLPQIAKVLPADTLFHLFAKVFPPIRCFVYSPKFFSATEVFHYNYGIQLYMTLNGCKYLSHRYNIVLL